MEVLMISPGWSKSSIWGHIWFKFPVLSLPALAAVTPKEHQIVYRDDNIENVLKVGSEDLVAITVMTPLAPRAYEIADFFISHGKTVVLGGVHPTFCPEEALNHADSILIGEAEQSWGRLLSDFETGKLNETYKSLNYIDGSLIPPVSRKILDNKKYFFTNLIQTTRGCPFDCEFCSVTSFYGGTYRVRMLDAIDKELSTIGKPGSFLFIVDDNIIGQPRFSKGLFELLNQYRFKWLSHSSINLAFNEKLLTAAAKSGCYGLFVGLESLQEKNLTLMGKKINKVKYYYEAIQRFHDVGIGVLGSFVLGYDFDELSSFEKIYEFSLKAKLDGGLFTLLTPFPGTKVRERLQKQNRLITSDWQYYDMEHVVFKPSLLTIDQLYNGFQELTLSFNSFSSIFKRLMLPRRSFQFFAPMNFGFHKAWKRVFTQNKRNDIDGN